MERNNEPATDETASEQPPAIEGHGGVIFDAAGNQQPSNGGQPLAPETEEENEPQGITTEGLILDFAALIQKMNRTYRTPPNIGLQIIQTVLQYQLQQQAQVMSRLPIEDSNG